MLLAGAVARANDLVLPDRVGAYANGTNTITATSFTDLPTTPCSVSITNPHASADLLVMVAYGAYVSTTTVACRVCPRISGAITVAAGIGTNAPTGGGQVIRAISSGATQYEQFAATYFAELPPGTSTFTMQSYRESASTTIQVNYATLDIVPLSYRF